MMPGGREHRRWRTRLLDVVRREAPVEADRRVQGERTRDRAGGLKRDTDPASCPKYALARPPSDPRGTQPSRCSSSRPGRTTPRTRVARSRRSSSWEGGLHKARAHAASYDCCTRGSTSPASSSVSSPASPSPSGDRLSRQFIRLTLPSSAAPALVGDVPAPARRRQCCPVPTRRRVRRRRARRRPRMAPPAASPVSCSTSP